MTQARSDRLELEHRVAVITGAASGLGAAMARRFSSAQMRLVLADIEEGPLDRLARELTDAGTDVHTMVVDVSDGEAVAALADLAYARCDAVHVLCNNAGVATGGRAWELTEADWRWVLDVDLWGVIHGVRAFVPRMIASGQPGHVVNTGSMTSLLAVPALAAYGAAKSAVASLSESLYLDLEAAGADIGVSVLCPGYVHTQIRDSARNRPDDVADAPPRPRQRSTDGVTPRMTAADVADAVANAVVHRDFWILTHDEYRPVIRARAEGIGAGGRPLAPPIW
jgi:NAD(P)-dependent dehydrogenase (short-subunit alcohol dehydrogenase family)